MSEEMDFPAFVNAYQLGTAFEKLGDAMPVFVAEVLGSVSDEFAAEIVDAFVAACPGGFDQDLTRRAQRLELARQNGPSLIDALIAARVVLEAEGALATLSIVDAALNKARTQGETDADG